MPTIDVSPRAGRPPTLGLLALVVLVSLGCGDALADPPIRSPEDAACRREARALVFSAPNPGGLELEDLGRGIYDVCMRRLGSQAARPSRHGKRRYRRRSR